MDTRETPAAKFADAAAPWKEPRDICALAIQRNFLTQEEIFLAQTGLCCLLLPKAEMIRAIYTASSKKAQYVTNKPSNKIQGKH